MAFFRDCVLVSEMFVAAGNLTLFRYTDTSEGKAKQMKLNERAYKRGNFNFLGA